MKQFYKFFFRNVLVAAFAMGTCNAQETYLDSSFGNGGIVTAELFELKDICIQQDGKILVAGMADNCVLYRFNTDGTPDTGFGTNGKVTFTGNSLVNIVQLPSGKLLALTSYLFPDFQGGYATRRTFTCLNSDGSLDYSFGPLGRRDIQHGIPLQMKLLPNGKIFVVGRSADYMYPMMAQFTETIEPDPGFGWDGDGYIIWAYEAIYKCMDVNSNGNLMIVSDIAGIEVNKYSPDGSPVYATTPGMGSEDDKVNDIIVLSDGKMLLSGSRPGNTREAVLLKLKSNGNEDNTFGSAGVVALPNVSGMNEVARNSIELSNGIILTGIQRYTTDYDFGLLFTDGTTGEPISSVGDTGLVSTPLANNQYLVRIVRQDDGKILAAGFDENNMVLVRYDISSALSTAAFVKHPQPAIYPNPANETVTISGLPDQTVMSLYNISGQKLKEIESNGDTFINISSFPSGIYFLNTSHGSTKIIKK